MGVGIYAAGRRILRSARNSLFTAQRSSFSIFGNETQLDRQANGNLSPSRINSVHFVLAAHKPNYVRSHSPGVVISPGKDVVVLT